MRYFIPEWDDLVDPHFDFETDTHSYDKASWQAQVYAHQLYGQPNCDGILISRVVAEKGKEKTRLINELGVHRYLRFGGEVMGDCGAFGYWRESTPPFTSGDILDYYTRLGFDIGVSIDHLIVPEVMEHRQERYDITLANAEEFLREHRAQGLAWRPVASIQGWDPWSYAEAARQCVAMGYRYIAIGSLTRRTTPDILRIIQAVSGVIPAGIGIHLFGIMRLGPTPAFVQMGVTSVDSASYLRQAFTSGTYHGADGEVYQALRVPPGDQHEYEALGMLRRYAKGQATVEDALDVLRLIDSTRLSEYRRTLEARPWERCPCVLCRQHGIEIAIFRGNNRNRRRGFHNTWVFYGQLQDLLAKEEILC